MIYIIMPHPNIIVSHTAITVPQFSLHGFNVEKILTFSEFFLVILIMFLPQEDL